jgi:hypothetical protein
VVIASLPMRVVEARLDLPVRRQLAALRPMIVASAVSWIATRATDDGLASANPIAAFAATVAACLIVYVAVVALQDRQVLQVALRQVRRVIPGRRAAPAAV